MAVSKLDAVLQNEVVRSGVVAVLYALVVQGNNSLVLTESHANLVVFDLGGQHADLGHSHDGAIIAGGVEEGVEQAVQLLCHDNKSISLLAVATAASGQGSTHAQAQSQAQDHGKNFLCHCLLLLNRFDRNVSYRLGKCCPQGFWEALGAAFPDNDYRYRSLRDLRYAFHARYVLCTRYALRGDRDLYPIELRSNISNLLLSKYIEIRKANHIDPCLRKGLPSASRRLFTQRDAGLPERSLQFPEPRRPYRK